MITLYRGDDTGGQLGKNVKIAFHCDDAVDMDGVIVHFSLLDVITKEWTNVHDGDILELSITHEQSRRLPLGSIFGKIWGEDPSGRVRTFANRLPIIVTNDLRKVYGSDGLDSQDIHVYSPVGWDAIANKPTLFPSKIELVDGLPEALDGMVKSVNGKTADAAGAVMLTLDSFANKDGEIQVKQTLMVSRDGGQTFNAVAALVDVWNEIDGHNSSATAHANLMAAIANTYARKSDIPLVSTTFTSADAGKAADAKAVGDALDGKLDKSGGTVTGDVNIEASEPILNVSASRTNYATLYVKNGAHTIRITSGVEDGSAVEPPKIEIDGVPVVLLSDLTAATKLTPVLDADGRVTGYKLGDKDSPVLLTDDAKTALFAGADFIAAVKKYGGTQIKEDEKGFYYEVDEEA